MKYLLLFAILISTNVYSQYTVEEIKPVVEKCIKLKAFGISDTNSDSLDLFIYIVEKEVRDYAHAHAGRASRAKLVDKNFVTMYIRNGKKNIPLSRKSTLIITNDTNSALFYFRGYNLKHSEHKLFNALKNKNNIANVVLDTVEYKFKIEGVLTDDMLNQL